MSGNQLVNYVVKLLYLGSDEHQQGNKPSFTRLNQSGGFFDTMFSYLRGVHHFTKRNISDNLANKRKFWQLIVRTVSKIIDDCPNFFQMANVYYATALDIL
ncbi:uncharacterized protein LOC142236038 [Haematobia irritans]|uniref:uncharacterized protein LOC142227677 n=1 Tax=Haematobia irritans TaxID=7368 RepID=UPI003F4FB7AC